MPNTLSEYCRYELYIIEKQPCLCALWIINNFQVLSIYILFTLKFVATNLLKFELLSGIRIQSMGES